jgi:hypothetical protein
MKRTTSPFYARRAFILSLLSFVAVAALVTFGVSARRGRIEAARARALSATNNQTAANRINNADDKDPNSPNAVGISATLTDNITPGTTKVAPGSTIDYTAVITSTGGAGEDATLVNYNAPLDANTTYLNGSVHASPIAFNDTYNWIGNTQLDTTARALPAVTANDVAVNATLPAVGTDTFNVVTQTNAATSLAGTVTLAANGSFVYTPPVGRPNVADGASVNDSFTYTITNSADVTLVGTGTVTITLTGRVWYLQAGAAGDGRSNTPSSSPSAMSTAADKSTDIFYIFSNASSLSGLFTVDAGQQLLGQGVNLVVNIPTLGSVTLFNSAAPTPTTTNGGNCVTLAGAPGNNTLSGFNIGNCTGGTAIIGSNVGTLNVSTLSINTNGGGLDLTGVGTPTVSVVLGGLTSSAGARNVNLVGLNGTFTLAGGTLSGATGNALHVDGGNAGLTYSGVIQNSGGRQVNIINKSSGTVALSGAVNGTGTGIFLDANGTSTINFTGGVVLSTGTNDAFTATGGGTINVCDEAVCNPAATGGLVNTLTTTTGTALNVVNTTIGVNKLEFQKIISNGSGTANGIVLNNAGTGGLTVAGNGGTCTTVGTTCTGGHISNKTGADGTGNGIGIYVNNTSNVSITRMKLNDFSNYAVRGTTVTNFTMNNCFIDGANGNNGGADEGTIIFDGLFGTSSFSGDTIKGGVEDNFRITNASGTSNVTIDSCTIRDNHTTSGNDNVHLRTNISASITAHVTNNVFAVAGGDHIQTIASDQSSMTIVATGNSLSGGHPNSLLQGITISGGNATPSDSTEVVRFNISNNGTAGAPMTGTIQGGAININQGSGNGNWQGQVVNNFIGAAASSCSGASQSSGVRLENHSKGVLIGIVSNNTIRQTCGAGGGISISAGDTTASGLGNGPLNATVQNNIVDVATPTPGSFDHGIVMVAGNLSGNTNQVCYDLLNNTSEGSHVVGSSGFAYRTRQRFDSTVRMPGYTGLARSTANVITYQSGRPNTAIAGDGGTFSVSVEPVTGGGFLNTSPAGSPCTQPIVPSMMANPAEELAHNQTENGQLNLAANTAPPTPIAGMASPLVDFAVPTVINRNHDSDVNNARRSHHPQFTRSTGGRNNQRSIRSRWSNWNPACRQGRHNQVSSNGEHAASSKTGEPPRDNQLRPRLAVNPD